MTTCIYDGSGMLLYCSISVAAVVSYIDLFELDHDQVTLVDIDEAEVSSYELDR